MRFSLLTIFIWTALGALFLACVFVKTRDASEATLLAVKGVNLLILMHFICTAIFTQGRKVFAASYGIAYLLIELVERMDRMPFVATIAYRSDLWIRYFLPQYTSSVVGASRQQSIEIFLQILFCVIGGAVGVLSKRNATKHL